MRRLRSAFLGALIGIALVVVIAMVVAAYFWWAWARGSDEEELQFLPFVGSVMFGMMTESSLGLAPVFGGILGAIVGAISPRSPRR
jgi:hypothetical protein